MQHTSRKRLVELQEGSRRRESSASALSLTARVWHMAGEKVVDGKLRADLEATRKALRESEASRRRVENRLAKELSCKELLQRQMQRAQMAQGQQADMMQRISLSLARSVAKAVDRRRHLHCSAAWLRGRRNQTEVLLEADDTM